MSIGPLNGAAASMAGSPLAQTKGADADRAPHDALGQQRVAQSEQKAEAAAGIGETDGQDHEAAERDADGRLPWSPRRKPPPAAAEPAEPPVASKDTTGASGNLLDLSG